MKKSYFKWFIPIFILFVLLTVAMLEYGAIVRKYAYEEQLSKATGELENGLNRSELVLKSIIDHSLGTAISLSFFDSKEDKQIIAVFLSELKSRDKVTNAMTVNEYGKGVGPKGEDIDISGTEMLRTINERFKDGGSGYLLINDGEYEKGSIASVNSYVNKNNEKSYLITIILNDELKDQLFDIVPKELDCFFVTLEGYILVHNRADGYEDFYKSFWDLAPEYLSPDTVKLAIVQKKRNMLEVKDYGYVIAIPSDITNGAIVAMASIENLEKMSKKEIHDYHVFCAAIFAAFLAYTLCCVIVLVLSEYIRRKRLKRYKDRTKRDALTGLYSEDGVRAEIDNYIKGVSSKQGLFFIVRVESFTRLRMLTTDDEADSEISEFAENFAMNFRETDIVGKSGDDEFMVFLKDMKAEKDIRKQIDEMQLFLHDLNDDTDKAGKSLIAFAGGAKWPENGANADELIKYSRDALNRSREDGNGRVSME